MSEGSRRRLALALWVATVLAYVVEVALLFANTDLGPMLGGDDWSARKDPCPSQVDQPFR